MLSIDICLQLSYIMHVFGKKSVTAFNLLVILCFAFLRGTSRLSESNWTKSKPFGCKTRQFTKEPQPEICFSISQCSQKIFVSLYLGLFHVKGATFNGGFKTNVQQHIKRLKEGVFQGPSHRRAKTELEKELNSEVLNRKLVLICRKLLGFICSSLQMARGNFNAEHVPITGLLWPGSKQNTPP